MDRNARIYVAGHGGMVGSAIVRYLRSAGYNNLLMERSSSLDLRCQQDVEKFFSDRKPEYVFLSAARVGGILANERYPAEFIYDNLMIEANVVHSSFRHGVKKLLFLGSTCIYPKFAPQPLKEESLLSGPLEPTNEPYAVAKIAGIKLVQAYRKQYGCRFISAMPTNLYGPGDNFDLEKAHVLPALIRKVHEARESGAGAVNVWGSGRPRREFLYVDDLAEACVFLMRNYDGDDVVNVGFGEDVTIRELAEMVAAVVGYDGALEFDVSKPDGTPRKLVDCSRMTALGWVPGVSLVDGIEKTYNWFIEHYSVVTGAEV